MMTKNKDGHATVLVVDDYEDLRSLTKRAVESFGYAVVEASNGQEAIEVARRELPDVILMDLSMPMLDGFAAILRIRRQAGLQDVPIVACSAHAAPQLRADALSAGCCAYLTKPVDINLLQATLAEILRAAAPDAGDLET
ncbi:MAG TPA: response regulator [Pyrinomonadaceae bacterium]|nr:response regulator [Pyrinomonadaceae bacterium]